MLLYFWSCLTFGVKFHEILKLHYYNWACSGFDNFSFLFKSTWLEVCLVCFVIQYGFACFHMSTQACDLLTFGIWTIEQSLMFSLSKQVKYLNSKLLWMSDVSRSLYLTRPLFLAIPPAVFLCIQCTYLQECVKHGKKYCFHTRVLFSLGSEELLRLW